MVILWFFVSRAPYKNITAYCIILFFVSQGYKILDSMAFLPTSLSNLATTLSQERKRNSRKLQYLHDSHLVRKNGVFSQELYTLCQQKLSFPFQYSYSREKMESITQLPPQSHFVSTLSGQAVKNEDYENVKRLWDILRFNNLYELYEYYCVLGRCIKGFGVF